MSTYEALGSVIHEAELEALFVFEGFGEGITQAVRWQHTLTTLLELAEYALEANKKRKRN